MFTFFCPTCEAKLIVKNEKLVGRIVPCPQCGGMVFVQSADDAPTPLVDSPLPVVHKRFPDVLSYETPSGIIGHASNGNLRAEIFLESVPAASSVSATEVNARKVLVGILVGLLLFLLLALGFLMVFQEPNRPQLPEPLPPEPGPAIQVPGEPPVEPEPAADVEGTENVLVTPLVEPPADLPPQGTPAEPEPVHEEPRVSNDTLSAIEERMPGFVDSSVPDIDIDAKLALPIGELNFEQSSLIEFIRVISRLTEIPMTLDIDEMKPRSLSVKTPVSGQYRTTTADEVLTTTLATVGMQWVAVDRQILIFPATTDDTTTADTTDLTFDISDLVAKTDDLTPEVLAEMIQRLLVPEANVVILPGNRLTIVQDENKPGKKSRTRQRDDILRFLEQLRAVRQLPQKTEWTGETLAPEAFGWDHVMVPMTLNHYRAVPLSRILAQLEAMTDVTIIVDHQSFHRGLCSFASIPATVRCDHGTVNDVLELSLASVDVVALTYRIIDHQTLEITTMESARQPEKMVMEVHRYELQADETPEDIVRSLRSAVAPHSWVMPEFPETHGGDLIIDRPSNCLFIRQSQPAQRQIRLFLSTPESATMKMAL